MELAKRLQWFTIIAIILGIASFVALCTLDPEHAVVLALLAILSAFLQSNASNV